MLLQLKNNKPNFSKIGKHISNKLHHITKEGSSKVPKRVFVRQKTHEVQSQEAEKSKITLKKEKENESYSKRTKSDVLQPTVGTYRVNYSIVDKNVHQFNFNRSTPHFFNTKYNVHVSTSCFKSYPDGFDKKQKGLTDLKRMVGRDQIKGNVRKNLQNPHQNRFNIQKFPTLTTRSGFVPFDKMSPRKQHLQNIGLTLPQYDYDYEINMRRLDSHIIQFGKQTNRDEGYLKQSATSEDYRYLEQFKPISLNKTVAWNKQLPREVQGSLPTYMDKSIHSRMAISLINLKTLQMNCTDLKHLQKKVPRQRANKLAFKKQNQSQYVQQNVAE